MGAWIETVRLHNWLTAMSVAPYVGAWIETSFAIDKLLSITSHPMWVRGLKQVIHLLGNLAVHVAPYVGAWIETVLKRIRINITMVAPYVGAWIETLPQRRMHRSI